MNRLPGSQGFSSHPQHPEDKAEQAMPFWEFILVQGKNGGD